MTPLSAGHRIAVTALPTSGLSRMRLLRETHMRIKATFIAGALLAAMSTAGHASVLPYKSLDRLVAESEGIVIGTVRRVETAAGKQPNDLYTFVTVDQLDVVHGQVANGALTLRLKGGFDGRQGLHVDGAPEFKPNERVLLFVQGNGRDLVPFVGWSQGVFRLVDDGAGHRFMRDADGNVVTGVQEGHVMRRAGEHLGAQLSGAPQVVRQRSAAPQAGGGTTENGSAVKELGVDAAAQPAMTVEGFLAEVRQRASAAKATAEPLRSLTPQDRMQEQGNGRDGGAMQLQGAASADAAVAMPSGNGVMLPAQRKPPTAADQR